MILVMYQQVINGWSQACDSPAPLTDSWEPKAIKANTTKYRYVQ